MKDKPIKYEIALSLGNQLIVVYPTWKGPRSGTTVIGEYAPENPRSNLSHYTPQLYAAIQEALLTVGIADYDAFRIMVTPLEGGREVMLKDVRTNIR